jgi:hypothetical protein
VCERAVHHLAVQLLLKLLPTKGTRAHARQ